MSKVTIGWDIGGAHLKASVVDSYGVVQQSIQVACQLWKGIAELEVAMRTLLDQLPSTHQHAVTMTGELVDCFENRHAGVCEIANATTKLLGSETLFYTTEQPFVTIEQVIQSTKQIASMNWHASAHWLAQTIDDALFVDIGSTTTDLIPIRNQSIMMDGVSDAERMAQGTLVYTGVVRTPLMAISQRIPFQQQQYYVAAEYFATIADVYRLLGELPVGYDIDETADGAGKTALASARRIARMIGHDLEDFSLNEWQILANNFKSAQQLQLTQAMEQHLPFSTIVGAGHGSFLIKEIADKLNKNYINIDQLIKAYNAQNATDAAVVFPAYAVAMLANQYAFS